MFRDEAKIGKLYGLGNPRKQALQVQSDLIYYLEGSDFWGYYHKPFGDMPSFIREEDNRTLVDHKDFFNQAITLIPYLTIENIHSKIGNSKRWELAVKAGMSYDVIHPDPGIYPEDIPFLSNANLIVLHCNDWVIFRRNLKKIIKGLYLEEINAVKEKYSDGSRCSIRGSLYHRD